MGLGIRVDATAQRAQLRDYGATPPIAPTEPPSFRRAARPPPGCPDLDCVRCLLADDFFFFATVKQSAAWVGVGADRVVVAAGDISEETYLRALASTAEYAAQFGFFLPGLAAQRLPLPLGGSSNHFRSATLRNAGDWDADNADLGMRLARFGYRCDTINSTFYEEAPARTGAWLRQRTRWFKGWMQTWFTRMQSPGRLLRDLGPLGFLSFQLIVSGNASYAGASVVPDRCCRRFFQRRATVA